MNSLTIISFTERGYKLSLLIKDKLSESEVSVYIKSEGLKDCPDYLESKVKDLVKECFKERTPLLFIGAAGIAVRMIAPFVDDKLKDAPVIVMDEWGDYVIPILSGHMGGANELALKLSKVVGGIPVITTATDVNHEVSFDLFAKRNNLKIKEREDIKKANARILQGKDVSFKVRDEIISFVSKEYCIGVGCKKNTEAKYLLNFLEENLSALKIDVSEIYCLASIDIKKDEEAIVEISRANHIPFFVYSKEQLNEIKGDFSESNFVKDITGVGNVCERAAILACGESGGELVLKKKAKDGMTLAIAKKNRRMDGE